MIKALRGCRHTTRDLYTTVQIGKQNIQVALQRAYGS
jgi:hypothetical protein